MRLYVGNLAYSTTEDTLRNEFGKFGNVTSALVVIDRVSGRSRGFGFVEFSTPDEGTQAINGMNGASLDGREIVVNEARERQAGGGGGGGGPRPGRGGGGGGGGGRRFGGGGGGGGPRGGGGDRGGGGGWGGGGGGGGDFDGGDRRRGGGRRGF
jgi:RNA recognition motif-containing protein